MNGVFSLRPRGREPAVVLVENWGLTRVLVFPISLTWWRMEADTLCYGSFFIIFCYSFLVLALFPSLRFYFLFFLVRFFIC